MNTKLLYNKHLQILFFLILMLCSLQLQAAILMQGGYSHEFTTVPGGVYKKSIKLKNMGRTAQEIKIYMEDYMFNAGGRSNFTAARLRKNPLSNSQWIKFSPNRLVLAPGAERVINYTMRVPRRRLTGTYWSALVIEPVAASSLESTRKHYNDKKVHMNIQQVARHAVQIVAQMGDTGKANIQFKHPVMKKESGKRTFSLDAYNVGTRWIKPDVWLDVYNQQGGFVGKFKGDGSRIYPRTSVTLPVDISRLRSGKYKGLFVVDGGSNSEILATDINLTIR